MQEGKIVERGTHAELLERKGEYFDMVGHEASRSSQEEHGDEETKEKGVCGCVQVISVVVLFLLVCVCVCAKIIMIVSGLFMFWQG